MGVMSRNATTPTRTFATWRSPSPPASNMAASGLFQNSPQDFPSFSIQPPWRKRPCVDTAAGPALARPDYADAAHGGATAAGLSPASGLGLLPAIQARGRNPGLPALEVFQHPADVQPEALLTFQITEVTQEFLAPGRRQRLERRLGAPVLGERRCEGWRYGCGPRLGIMPQGHFHPLAHLHPGALAHDPIEIEPPGTSVPHHVGLERLALEGDLHRQGLVPARLCLERHHHGRRHLHTGIECPGCCAQDYPHHCRELFDQLGLRSRHPVDPAPYMSHTNPIRTGASLRGIEVLS